MVPLRRAIPVGAKKSRSVSRASPCRLPKQGVPAALRACVTLVVACVLAGLLSFPAAATVLGDARAIEPEMPGFPEKAQAALLALLPEADAAPIAVVMVCSAPILFD